MGKDYRDFQQPPSAIICQLFLPDRDTFFWSLRWYTGILHMHRGSARHSPRWSGYSRQLKTSRSGGRYQHAEDQTAGLHLPLFFHVHRPPPPHGLCPYQIPILNPNSSKQAGFPPIRRGSFPFRDQNGIIRKNNPKNPPIRPVARSSFTVNRVQFEPGLLFLRYLWRSSPKIGYLQITQEHWENVKVHFF